MSCEVASIANIPKRGWENTFKVSAKVNNELWNNFKLTMRQNADEKLLEGCKLPGLLFFR